MGVVQGAKDEGSEENGEGEKGDCSYCDKAGEVETGCEAFPHEVGCDGWGVVKCHLLEAQRCDEEDAGPEMSAR